MKLAKIYNWLKMVLGFELLALGFVSLGYGLQLPEATPETHLTLILLATCTLIVLGVITFDHGVCGIDKIREKKNADSMTRQEIVDKQVDWMVREHLGWSAAKRVADKYMTPEEWEIFYDKVAGDEWEAWVRFDAPALPQTKFSRESLDKMFSLADWPTPLR